MLFRSRILHQNDTLIPTLERILVKVLVSYPDQGFWAMASGAKSQTARRSKRNMKVFGYARVRSGITAPSFKPGR